MNDPNYTNKLSREERWEARRRAKFNQDNSFDKPQDNSISLNFSNPPSQTFEPPNKIEYKNIPEPIIDQQYLNYPQEKAIEPNPPLPNQNLPNSQVNLSPKSFQEIKKIQQQDNLLTRGKTPPSNSFFMNPVSDAEAKRIKMQEDYKAYALRDLSKKRDDYTENIAPSNNMREKVIIDQQQSEDIIKKQMYSIELKKQIGEKAINNKRNQRQIEKVEEYFPFGKPGAGAPFRDYSGRIIATRPPKLNENDPNFNKVQNRSPQIPPRIPQEFYDNYPPQYIPQNAPPQYIPSQSPPSPIQYSRNPPPAQYSNPSLAQYSNPPPAQYSNPPPAQYSNPPPAQYSNAPPAQYSNPQPIYTNPPPVYSNPPQYANAPSQYLNSPLEYNQYPPPTVQPPKHTYSNNLIQPPPPAIYEGIDPIKEYEKSGEMQRKIELQRALQEQIEEKQRKKDEEKRRKLLEERYEEERLMKERQQREEDFRREAEKKKQQINDLQTFNTKVTSNVVAEPVRKVRRPRTPIDMPPIEQKHTMPTEDVARRGQSATRNPVYTNQVVPPLNINSNPKEIPQDYINFLNSALDKKINEFKGEYKIQELRQQEEIVRLKSRNQANSEQNMEAQREIERLKDELRRKQVEEDIRHQELSLALLGNAKNIVSGNTKLPPYEPRPLILPKSTADASLSFETASKSLNSETKFIKLSNERENSPKPKEKSAINLDTVFPSLPDSYSNLCTIRSASSSIGIDNIMKKNEERLKNLEKFDTDPKDELSKLDEILFKFTDNDKLKNDFDTKSENLRYESQSRKIATPVLFGKGDFLPSIKEIDGDGTYSLPDRSGFNVY